MFMVGGGLNPQGLKVNKTQKSSVNLYGWSTYPNPLIKGVINH